MPRLAPVAAVAAALALLSLLHLSAALPAPHTSRRPGQIATTAALSRSCLGPPALHLSAVARLRGGDGEDEVEGPVGEGGKESQAKVGGGEEGVAEGGSAVAEDAVAETGQAESSGDELGGDGAEQGGDLVVRRAAFGIVYGSRSKVFRPAPRIPLPSTSVKSREPAATRPRHFLRTCAPARSTQEDWRVVLHPRG